LPLPLSPASSARNKTATLPAAEHEHAEQRLRLRRHGQFFVERQQSQCFGPKASQSGSRARKLSGSRVRHHSQNDGSSPNTLPPRSIRKRKTRRGSLAFIFFLGCDFHAQRISRRQTSLRRGNERYDPVAKASERTPSISTAITSATPSAPAARQPLIQYSIDHRGHQPCLRRGSFVAADALRPLIFDLLAPRVVEIFPVGNFMRTQRITST